MTVINNKDQLIQRSAEKSNLAIIILFNIAIQLSYEFLYITYLKSQSYSYIYSPGLLFIL